MKRWVWLVVGVVVVVIAVGSVLLFQGSRRPPSSANVRDAHEVAYATAINVAGYQRVTSYFDTNVNLVFIGSPSVAVSSAISGPNLVLSDPPKIPGSDNVGSYVADGTGSLAGGVTCSVRVKQSRPGGQQPSAWRLDRQQAAQVTAGTSDILAIGVVCGPQ